MNWNFDNTYTNLPNIYYSKVKPYNFENPKLLLFNTDLANELNLQVNNNEKEICDFLLGKNIDNKNFISQAYAGHQFGHFTILGDGRALLLGEHINNDNERYDIQLKGSGQTPYSRNGDGKATLGPMIREYIVSEAMNNLQIPSTRALAIITTGEKVLRDKLEPGAILVRVAKSHIRVGTFQFGSLLKNVKEFESLINYTIKRLYPEIKDNKNKYLIFFKKVCELQINLIINWMRVGFIHGVMNTDNTSLSGETIDFGPCAFMDSYNPKTVFSSIDRIGRYSFENQFKITLWNLARFAETFLHLINTNENSAIKIIEEILKEKKEKFNESWLEMMNKKLSLDIKNNNNEIIKEFLDLMHIHKLDFTNTFLDLEKNTLDMKIFKNWFNKYNLIKSKKYNNVNPYIIPRNHMLERVIKESYKDDFTHLFEFDKILSSPYKENKTIKKYMQPPNEQERVFQTFCGT